MHYRIIMKLILSVVKWKLIAEIGLQSTQEPTWCYICEVISLTNERKMLLLLLFTVNPVLLEKVVRADARALADQASPFIKTSKSSAKQRWVMIGFIHLGWKVNFPDSTFLRIIALNPSKSITKRQGERGYPCLMPLFHGYNHTHYRSPW